MPVLLKSDGVTRCVPLTDFQLFDEYSSPDCSESEVAEDFTYECPTSTFYSIGEPVEGDLFTFDASGCREVTESERAQLRSLGEPIDVATFEAGTVSPAAAARFSLPGSRGQGGPLPATRARPPRLPSR